MEQTLFVARGSRDLRLAESATNRQLAAQEVVVPKADSLVGGGVSLDRLDRLLHKRHHQKFPCCFVAFVDPFRVVVCRHVPTEIGRPCHATTAKRWPLLVGILALF